MCYRYVVILLPFAASLALGGKDMTQLGAKAHGMDSRSLAVRRPVAVPTAAYISEPLASLPVESSGAPLDRSPLEAYPPGSPGSAQTVSGQCFVVTDGGHRIELAQVDVRVYAQREFEWYAQEINARSKARFEGMRSIACPANFAALSVPEMDRSLAAAGVLQHDLHVAWQAMPAAEGRTTTDAHGRFKVTHHVAPPYIIFATGSRTVGREIEYYRWQISSLVIGNPMELVLSNDDLR